MWEELSSIQVHNPWLCIGNFNCTLEDGERTTARGPSSNFINGKDALGLLDLGFTCPKFTWNHGTDPTSRRPARLDRCLCNEEGRRAFPKANVKHLPHSYSDHCPLLLQLLSKRVQCLGVRPFRF